MQDPTGSPTAKPSPRPPPPLHWNHSWWHRSCLAVGTLKHTEKRSWFLLAPAPFITNSAAKDRVKRQSSRSLTPGSGRKRRQSLGIINCLQNARHWGRFSAPLVPFNPQIIPQADATIGPIPQVLKQKDTGIAQWGVRDARIKGLLRCRCRLVAQRVWPFRTPMGCSPQAPLSMEFPSKDTGVGSHFLLWGIFPTQGLNSRLLHWQTRPSPLSHRGSGLSDTHFGWVYSAIPIESLDLCFLEIFLKRVWGGGFPEMDKLGKCYRIHSQFPL